MIVVREHVACDVGPDTGDFLKIRSLSSAGPAAARAPKPLLARATAQEGFGPACFTAVEHFSEKSAKFFSNNFAKLFACPRGFRHHENAD